MIIFAFYQGERIEIEYNLQSYGIYVDQIPWTSSGSIKLQNLKQWMKVREAIESQRDETNNMNDYDSSIGIIVECPGMTDVIVSTGDGISLDRRTLFTNHCFSKM